MSAEPPVHSTPSSSVRYLILGVLFGCLFPLLATSADAVLSSGGLTLTALLKARLGSPVLHGIIDTAPVFLGFFAWVARRRQDEATRALELLRAANVQLGEQQHQLQSALSVKRQLMRRMSHELRTPLNAIIGLSELLLASSSEARAESRDYLGRIHEAGERLARLVDDVIDLNRLEEGRLLLNFERVDATELLQQSAAAIHAVVEEAGLELRIEAAEKPAPIVVDVDRLQRIIEHLVLNAVRHAGRGSITMRCAADGAQVRLEILDEGPGLPSPDGPSIFEDFNGCSDAADGVGLGLAVAKRLVEEMGGSVVAKTRTQGGCFVGLEFPAGGAAMPLEQRSTRSGETTRAAMTDVLIIDSDATAVELLRTALSHRGLSVDATMSSQVAINRTRRSRPHVIVMDLMLAGEEGWTVLAAFLTDPVLSRIPVVIYTAKDPERVLSEFPNVKAWLLKPRGLQHVCALAEGLTRLGAGSSLPNLSLA